MGVARCEKAVRYGTTGVFLNRQKQGRGGLVKASLEKLRFTDSTLGCASALARAQAQRGLDMRDRKIGLTGPQPGYATRIPAAGIARVEREGAVDERHRHADVLDKLRQHDRRISANAGVVVRHLQGTPGKIDSPAATCIRRFDPTVDR